jgi:RNA polymerase sigma-70 factor (ECF subfamily)
LWLKTHAAQAYQADIKPGQELHKAVNLRSRGWRKLYRTATPLSRCDRLPGTEALTLLSIAPQRQCICSTNAIIRPVASRSETRRPVKATVSVSVTSVQTANKRRDSRLTSSLLEKVAQGDQSSVAACLDQYGNLIWSLARRFLGNSADAEDAVQDIFIEIWSNAGRFDPAKGSEVTFVATIARRRLIDRLRKHRRTPGSEEYNEELASQNPETSNGIAENTEVQNVVRVLGAMPEEHREILAMSIYEGYSHSEIADIMQIPLGTVKTRVRRGLMHIREQLQIDASEIAENDE